MFAFLKSMFANEPDRYVMFNMFKPKILPEEKDKAALFGDLPRLINPQGIDDTDKICDHIIEAYPRYADFPDQTSNRRNLYMAIHSLRQTEGGWVSDKYAVKVAPKPSVLRLSVA